MRVIRSTYRGAAEWWAQRAALQRAPSAAVPPLEPAVVVSQPEEHAHGPGVLIEAVGPDGKALYQRLIACQGSRADQLEEAIEAGIQEAWRHLVQHVRPTDEELGP
jgi:hypothetical protein